MLACECWQHSVFFSRRRCELQAVFYRRTCRHFVGARAVYKISKQLSGRSKELTDSKLFVARCLHGIYKRTNATSLKAAGEPSF